MGHAAPLSRNTFIPGRTPAAAVRGQARRRRRASNARPVGGYKSGVLRRTTAQYLCEIPRSPLTGPCGRRAARRPADLDGLPVVGTSVQLGAFRLICVGRLAPAWERRCRCPAHPPVRLSCLPRVTAHLVRPVVGPGRAAGGGWRAGPARCGGGFRWWGRGPCVPSGHDPAARPRRLQPGRRPAR